MQCEVDEAVLGTGGGGPHQEYFYIQLPRPLTGHGSDPPDRRFIYVPGSSNSSSSRFPMLFGLELLAECVGRPERANWKHCVVSEAEEERAADSFKQLFAPFDFAA